MEISVMTLIIAVGGDIKWIMKLTICLIPLNKIIVIIYIYMDL